MEQKRYFGPIFASVLLTTIIISLLVPAKSANLPAQEACAFAKTLNDRRLSSVCSELHYLGNGTFTELGLIPNDLQVLDAIAPEAANREEVAGRRHFFSFDAFVISARSDTTQALDMVLRAAAGILTIKSSHTYAYDFIISTMTFQVFPTMKNTPWKNRNKRIVLSFDKTPQFIAASGTLLGHSITTPDLALYQNYAIISIDEETIIGTNESMGSKRIYRRPTAEENYQTYMNDGLLFSLIHEAVHLYVTQHNSTSNLAYMIYQSRQSGGRDAEEIIANTTAMAIIGPALSAEMRGTVSDENRNLAAKAGVKEILKEFRKANVGSAWHLVIPN